MVQVLHFELITDCPLQCKQCTQDKGRKKLLSRVKFFDLLTEAASLGIEVIGLSGGEPLLYPYLTEGLQKIKALGMLSALSTSGWGLDQAKIKELANLDLIFVSLNGSTERINQKSRDGYQTAINALTELQKADSIEYGINWTARQDNVEDFVEMIKLAKAYGARWLNVLRSKPFDEVDVVIPRIEDSQITIVLQNCFSKCQAGKDIITVNADGDFAVCCHSPYYEKHNSIQEYLKVVKPPMACISYSEGAGD